ncbi:nucleotidyl transferase AbiEii/AbiGii toxin family protein [Candidatus Peregrinibacteria bacterium]|nr:nucleotidyl transferase AbiEii/AbiGii toxin family protein [Candidatus Peregrinibacteria bacterium]
MISQNQIREFSKRYAIDEFTIIREYLQVVFLSALYSMKKSQKIYFKGGTAIRLLFNAGRFSEDLDFTTNLTIAELNTLIKNVLRKVLFIIPDTSLKKVKKGNKSYSGILSYTPKDAKYPLSLHLEFSIREIPETSEEHVLQTDFPIPSGAIIKHLSFTEILAEKIRALMLRSKGRDMYDLWFLLSKGVELDLKMVNRKMKFYHIEFSAEDILERIQKFDEKQLKNDLQKFLRVHDRNLIPHLKELILQQMYSRQEFSIALSENIAYNKIPMSFSSLTKTKRLPHTFDEAKTFEIQRQDENTLMVRVIQNGKKKDKGDILIQALNRNGVRELGIIEKNSGDLIGIPYAKFIQKIFRMKFS